MSHVAPRRLPLVHVLLELVNSGRYAIATSMITGGFGPMREAAAHIMWKVILGIRICENEVRLLFFGSASSLAATPSAPGRFVPGMRYYDEPSNPQRVDPTWMRMDNELSASGDESLADFDGALPTRPASPEASYEPQSGDEFVVDKAPSGPSAMRGGSPRYGESPVRVDSAFARRRIQRLVSTYADNFVRGTNDANESSSSAPGARVTTLDITDED